MCLLYACSCCPLAARLLYACYMPAACYKPATPPQKTKKGRRLLPLLALDAPPALLAAAGEWGLLALTAAGTLSLFDLKVRSDSPTTRELFFSGGNRGWGLLV